MPVVRYGARKVGLEPLPGVRKSAGATPESEGAGLAQAQGNAARVRGRAAAQVAGAEGAAGLGEQVARIGLSEMTRLAGEARQHADETALMDFDRQTADFENAHLHDAETGVLNTVKGKDALGLAERITADFDEFIGPRLAQLQPRQRAGAERLAHSRRAQMAMTLEQYAAKQSDLYEGAVVDASLTSSAQLAIAASTEPFGHARIGEELARQKDLITVHAAHVHQPAEVTQAQIAASRTATHTGVIHRYLSLGLDRKAQIYFEEVKDHITGDKLAAIEQALDAGTTAGAGLRASDAIWTQHGPKGDADPIALDAMEAAARSQFGDDPKALDATLHFLRERKSGLDAARADRKEAIAGTLWSAVNQGVSLAQLRTMPAYLAAPGALQLQVAEHVVSAAEQRANRTYTEGQRAKAAQADDPKTWARYWDLSNPATLSQMTENQIVGLTPEIGVDHVGNLLTARRALGRSEQAVRAATIDDELFKTIAASAGLKPYDPEQNETAKATLGQLRNAVEAAIDVEQQKKNATLSRDEKQKIMTSILDRKVLLDRWGTDPSALAVAVVNPKDREAAYVPIAQIPERSLGEWVNVIRSQFPSAQRLSRAEIVTRYGPRIQRAHAANVLGLGVDEETRRLQGR